MAKFSFTTRRMSFDCETLAEASEAYTNVRDGLGLGMSEMRPAALFDETGKRVGHISYNGRIWEGRSIDWTPATKLLFDNREPKEGRHNEPVGSAADAAINDRLEYGRRS